MCFNFTSELQHSKKNCLVIHNSPLARCVSQGNFFSRVVTLDVKLKTYYNL